MGACLLLSSRAGAQLGESEPRLDPMLFVILGLVALVVLSILARRWRVSWLEIIVLGVLVIAAVRFVPVLLHALTDGRAAFDETLPWTALLTAAVAVGWLALRRRPGPGPARRKKAAASRSRQPAPAAHTSPPERSDGPGRTVFISYRRADSADVTGRIYDRLAQRFGRDHVYKDVDSVPLGVDFRRHVDELVGHCDALIAVIGRRWLSAAGEEDRRLDDPGDLVRLEIGAALERGIPVIPLLVGGAAIPSEDELPDDLRDLAYRNGIPVRPDPDFHADLDRLIAGLEAHFRG